MEERGTIPPVGTGTLCFFRAYYAMLCYAMLCSSSQFILTSRRIPIMPALEETSISSSELIYPMQSLSTVNAVAMARYLKSLLVHCAQVKVILTTSSHFIMLTTLRGLKHNVLVPTHQTCHASIKPPLQGGGGAGHKSLGTRQSQILNLGGKKTTHIFPYTNIVHLLAFWNFMPDMWYSWYGGD